MVYEYDRLPSDDLSHSPTEQPSHRATTSKRRTKIIVAGCVGVITCIAATLMVICYNQAPFKSPNCGWDVDTARANGCIFEPMLRSWIPALCYTPYPSDEYHPFDDRPWFWDNQFTRPLADSELDLLRNGENIVAYTRSFHAEHCLYAQRKLALAVLYQYEFVDTKTMSLHHLQHCSISIGKLIYDVMYTGASEELVQNSTSMAPIMFQECVRLPWAKKGWLGLW